MDIFIETESDFIIIENKINAGDQENQIKDYVEYVKTHYEVSNNVFVCYLTKFGVEPTEKSITKEQLNILRKNNQFVSLSYSEDVLNWLSKLTVKENEEVLKSGREHRAVPARRRYRNRRRR
jgi:UDP-N-acetylmuramyl pentapeptide synthase